MKKNRLSSFLLALSLTLGLLAPMGAAQAAESRSAILDGMEVEATAAILVDTTYGSLDVLYDQNSHERRYPASITKVMTALLTVEAVDNGQLSLDDWITVGPEVNHEVGSGSSTQNIKEGEVMRLEDVLYCGMQRAGSGGGGQRGRLCGLDEPAGGGAGHDRHPLRQHPWLPQ